MTVEDTVGNLVGIALVIADREIKNSGNYFLYRVKLFDDNVVIHAFSGIHLNPVVKAIRHEKVCSVIFLIPFGSEIISFTCHKFNTVECYSDSGIFAACLKLVGEQLECVAACFFISDQIGTKS